MNPATAHALRLLGGTLLAALWVAGATLVISLSLMGTLMANDSGEVPAEAQTRMILMVLGGQVLAGLAGLPLGLAVFWGARRKLLLRIFAGLLAVGVVLIIAGVYTFAANLPG